MDCWFCKSFSLKMEGSLKINHQRLADISHKRQPETDNPVFRLPF